jgi:YD repeat-containing protein
MIYRNEKFWGGRSGVIEIRDRFGNRVLLARSATKNLTRIMSASGRTVEFTYDTGDRIIQAKDILGATVTYAYDASGRLTTVTDQAGGVTTYTYDASGRMRTLTDARGRKPESSNRAIALLESARGEVEPIPTDPVYRTRFLGHRARRRGDHRRARGEW